VKELSFIARQLSFKWAEKTFCKQVMELLIFGFWFVFCLFVFKTRSFFVPQAYWLSCFRLPHAGFTGAYPHTQLELAFHSKASVFFTMSANRFISLYIRLLLGFIVIDDQIHRSAPLLVFWGGSQVHTDLSHELYGSLDEDLETCFTRYAGDEWVGRWSLSVSQDHGLKLTQWSISGSCDVHKPTSTQKSPGQAWFERLAWLYGTLLPAKIPALLTYL
jgi:hypothetical protein